MDDDDDNFTSITWESAEDAKSAALAAGVKAGPSTSSSAHPADAPPSGVDLVLGTHSVADPYSRTRADPDDGEPKWEGYLMVDVTEARKEHEGTKEMFVSYGIRAETNLRHFSRTRIATRRRFQDFVFLRENLVRDFPACVVAPLPDKHRLEYLTGDRFSDEFIARRVADLQLFLERICRHPTLQRSQLLRSFLESTEWHVEMHMHTSSAASSSTSGGVSAVDEGPRAPQGILDTLSDTFLNAFSKVRKPDEKFEAMKDRLDKFDEGLTGVERVVNKGRIRWTDLAGDYEELAQSIEGLGYLESGITDALNRFAATNLDWARVMRDTSGRSTEELSSHLHAILAYSAAHRSVLKLRDQKQLDFEELTDYLSSVVSERDRLASLSSPYGAGHGHGGVRGVGIAGYLKDKVDSFRGVDEERTRVERMQRLDVRIKELQEAVTLAHDVSVAFSDEVVRENKTFHMAKDQEMRDLLGVYTEGQVEMWRRGAEAWDQLIPALEAIKVDG
ncbi:unnamed protein product [Parajaminaea phylloscopi]